MQLDEGKNTFQLIPELDTFTKNLQRLYAFDAAGQEWDVPRINLHKVIAEPQEYVRRHDGE
jgi:hypothetical protein